MLGLLFILGLAAAQEEFTCEHEPNFPAGSTVCAAIAKFITEEKIEQPFWLSIGDTERRLLTCKHKGFNETEPIIIFSATKWLTAATALRLVDEGVMSLEDKTSKYIDWWTTDPKDPRSLTTLRHHLSMTDGFGYAPTGDQYPPPFPMCWAHEGAEHCTREVYNTSYAQLGRWVILPECPWDTKSFALSDPDVPKPGEVFFYEECHWDMVEVMIEKATGQKFNQVATAKLFEPLGMTGIYNWPSYENPDLGGGVTSTGPSYEKFLKAVLGRQLLTQSAWDTMLQPHTMNAKHGKSVLDCMGPDHARSYGYGLGNWLHCTEKMPSACLNNHRHSSFGFGGFMPAVDFALGYYLVIAQLDFTGASQVPALKLQEKIFQALHQYSKTEL